MQREHYDELCHRIGNACTKYGLYARGIRKAIDLAPFGNRTRLVMTALLEMIEIQIREILDALNQFRERRRDEPLQ